MHGLINTHHGDRPQLVDHQYLIERPTRLIRFATRLGLAKGNKPMLQAVEQAFTFIASQYAPGDQVILVTRINFKWETDPNAKALKLLARHLCDGTNPGNYSTVQQKNAQETANARIPI
ncbi:unnamed protein product [Rhizoctonia solani]|uniref:Uncharacterized protein n=2 Tax=Rhizoctonia solani TaxID=456999 RepID=A0A8H3DF24_9AGAM|nr:unnamed protein product [Rhizoctonia solani]